MEKRSIGAFIAALRKANGLTQRQLAKKLNVSEKAVSRWERDEAIPDLSLIPALEEILGVTADELLQGKRSSEGRVKSMSEKQRSRLLAALQSKCRVRSAAKKLRNTTLVVTAIILLLTLIGHAAVVFTPTDTYAEVFIGGTVFEDWQSFRKHMETPTSALPNIVPPGQANNVIKPIAPNYAIDGIDPYESPIQIIKAPDGAVLCSYRPLNETVSHIVYSESEDKLPVTVYSQSQLRAASELKDQLDGAFRILYIIELIAAAVFYYIRKRKIS